MARGAGSAGRLVGGSDPKTEIHHSDVNPHVEAGPAQLWHLHHHQDGEDKKAWVIEGKEEEDLKSQAEGWQKEELVQWELIEQLIMSSSVRKRDRRSRSIHACRPEQLQVCRYAQRQAGITPCRIELDSWRWPATVPAVLIVSCPPILAA